MNVEAKVQSTAWDAPKSFPILSEDSPYSVSETTNFAAKKIAPR